VDVTARLQQFAEANNLLRRGPGPLSVALVITRHAKNSGLPIHPEKLLTKGGGQVKGLGKSGVQAILRDHSITRVLSEEGGRTSRGTPKIMRAYAEFLNKLSTKDSIDLNTIEKWWVDRVREHFAAKPFVLRFDPAKSIRTIVGDLLAQAQKRQAEAGGTMFAGTVLQHLVGAKLDLLLGGAIEHHGASVADRPSGRGADFLIGDVAMHVTVTPGEGLVRKCERNLQSGLRPVIVTILKGVPIASGLADQSGVADRIDIFEAEQFLAGNLYELGKFAAKGRLATAKQLIERYNAIVAECESDPSLRVNMGE